MRDGEGMNGRRRGGGYEERSEIDQSRIFFALCKLDTMRDDQESVGSRRGRACLNLVVCASLDQQQDFVSSYLSQMSC